VARLSFGFWVGSDGWIRFSRDGSPCGGGGVAAASGSSVRDWTFHTIRAFKTLRFPELVVKKKADLGVVVDPDVDRLAFICEDGEMFGEEYTLVLR
jgi:hypothetical protein